MLAKISVKAGTPGQDGAQMEGQIDSLKVMTEWTFALIRHKR